MQRVGKGECLSRRAVLPENAGDWQQWDLLGYSVPESSVLGKRGGDINATFA